MLQGDFRTQARLSQHLKDVRLMLDLAAGGGLSLPLSEIHCRLLEECASAGYGDDDNSAIIRVFARNARTASPDIVHKPRMDATVDLSHE